MDIAAWLARASADAEARGLPELKPLLETLARSTQALRDADPQFGHPAAEHEPRNTAAEHAEREPRNTRNTRNSDADDHKASE